MQTTAESLDIRERIRRERLPLGSHDLAGVSVRAWAAAVCGAEVAHRDADFTRAVTSLGISVDRYGDPDCVEIGQFPHEAYAAAAMNWLSHLRAHESLRGRSFRGFRSWSAAERQEWINRRRYLWAGALRQIKRYREARAAINQPASQAVA